MSNSRNHHFVPRHLIKEFRIGQPDQVFCFDKHEDKSWVTSTKNIFVERDFNAINVEFEGVDFVASSEETMSHIENQYLQTLRKVIKNETVVNLSEHENLMLCSFAAFQYLRTKAFRDGFERLADEIREKIGPVAKGSVAEKQLQPLDDVETKRLHLQMLRENLPELAASLATNKDMILLKSPENEDFILGDNPVVMDNRLDHSPYGNIGWDVAGIQISVPISPKLSLSFWCKSLIDTCLSEADETSKLLLRVSLAELNGYQSVHSQMERAEATRAVLSIRTLAKEIRDDQFARLEPEHVTFQNSLQISAASRFLVSRKDNFSLAKQMLRDDERFKFAYGRDVKRPPKSKLFL